MKIDVEGYEREVLSGADFSQVNPTVLVIEATPPTPRSTSRSIDWSMYA
jgi:hypothetical protein